MKVAGHQDGRAFGRLAMCPEEVISMDNFVLALLSTLNCTPHPHAVARF